MSYRLLLPSTNDLVPADVHAALKPFGVTALSDRGCAWRLPQAGAPGVAADAGTVIVRLLPVKALGTNPGEPSFRVPEGTERAVEVITPADEPRPADCRRVHDCATALANALHLGILNPYRGVYSKDASSYCSGLTGPPESDSIRVRCLTDRTERKGKSKDRTRPTSTNSVQRTKGRGGERRPRTTPQPGLLSRVMMRLRGQKRHRLELPTSCGAEYVESLLRQIRNALPIAKVSFDRRRCTILIDAPDTPLVSRTVTDLVRRYGDAQPVSLEVRLAHS